MPPSRVAANDRLGPGATLRYAIGSVGTGGFATLPGLVLVFYLTDTLGVAALAAGIFVTLAKVWDVVIDPVIGAWSDREFARRGTRNRLMILGGALIPVFFTLTFAVPPGLPPVASATWVFAAFLLAATAFSLFQVPYIGLPAELIGSYDGRTRLLAVRVVVLSVAILLFGAGGPALRRLGGTDEHLGYLLMGIVAGLVLGAAFIVASTTAGRRSLSAPVVTGSASGPGVSIGAQYRRAIDAMRTSRAFRLLLGAFALQALAVGLMLAGTQYVAKWVLGDTNAVEILFAAFIAPAVFLTPVWALIARRIGKTRAFTWCTVLFVVATLTIVGMAWAPGAWIYAPVALVGAAYAGMQAIPMAMLPDVISHDAAERGESRSGAFSGTWTAGETAAMALGTTILTIVLALTGYVESVGAQAVAQPQAAIVGIVVSFSIVPAILGALSFPLIARYPLTRAMVDRGVPAGVVEPGANA